MKKMILMMALIVGATAYGQTEKAAVKELNKQEKIINNSDNIQRDLKVITETFNLNKDQQTQTENLLKLKADAYKNMPDMDAATREEVDQKFESEFRHFLNPEQREIMDRLVKERAEKRAQKQTLKKQEVQKKTLRSTN